MTATLDGTPLRINPKSVAWTYTLKMAVIDTIGGKVTQIYGVSLGDLTIEGEFGAGGFIEQQEFFNRIVAVIDTQMNLDKPAQPMHFFWAERGWEFWCYVKALSEIGAQEAFNVTNENINPKYRLILQIQDDDATLTKTIKSAAQAAFIGRLTAGLGWKQSVYNGPLGYDEMNTALNGEDPMTAVFDQNLIPGIQNTLDAALLTDPISSSAILQGALTTPDVLGGGPFAPVNPPKGE